MKPLRACNNRVWSGSSSCSDPLYGSASSNKKIKPLAACNNSNWSRLPKDILSLIIDRLDIDDCVRFGAVCTSWQSIFGEEISSKRPSPFLLVAPPSPEPNDQHRALYSPSHNKLCTSRLRVPRRKACRGSSFGWLVTLEAKSPRHFQIQLLNPFQNRVIDLPPPDNIVQQHSVNIHGWGGCFLHKAVLSSDPCSSPADFVVMAIMSIYQGLAFFKAGDTAWTSIGDDWCGDTQRNREVKDILFVHNTNQFYALYGSGEVAAIDLLGDEGGSPKLTLITPPPKHISFSFPAYLVEDLSSGDLLVVYKNVSHGNIFQDYLEAEEDNAFADPFDAILSAEHKVVVQFDVFKIDTSLGIQIRIDNLSENVMFLGGNSSILRPSSDCPGCESNCIYYVEDSSHFTRLNFDCYGLPDDGVYSLKDGTVRPHYSSERFVDIDVSQVKFRNPLKQFIPSPMEYLPQPIWLEPTLKRLS